MKKYIIIAILLSLGIPILTKADMGMIPVWPPDVNLQESNQNAIAAWNGEEEILILSTDITADQEGASVLRIIPLPDNPTKVDEAKFESFEKLVEIMNQKLSDLRETGFGGKNITAPQGGEPAAVITFHKKIGAHDINVVKINNLDEFLKWEQLKDLGIKELQITNEFRSALENYMARNITYFAFDKIEVGKEKISVTPISYHFKSDYLYYPIKLTAFSATAEKEQSINDEVHLFAITKNSIDDPENIFSHRYPKWNRNPSLKFDKEELKSVSEDLSNLFNSEAYVTEIGYVGGLYNIQEDIIIYSSTLWQKNFTIGSKGKDVLALQSILINEGLWNSKVAATGYFGSITKQAVIKFQEKYPSYILAPWKLTKGTGFVGPYTRQFLNQFQMQ